MTQVWDTVNNIWTATESWTQVRYSPIGAGEPPPTSGASSTIIIGLDGPAAIQQIGIDIGGCILYTA